MKERSDLPKASDVDHDYLLEDGADVRAGDTDRIGEQINETVIYFRDSKYLTKVSDIQKKSASS